MNAVYRSGGVVIRVGRPTAQAASSLALAKALAAAGVTVPTPASERFIEEDGLTATCWHAVVGVETAIDWSAVGAQVRRVHGLDRRTLPAAYPIPSPATFPWLDFDDLVAELRAEIDHAAMAAIEATVECHRGWQQFDPGTPVVCHGDIHPGNVMMSADGPVLLDWDLMCVAPPGWDHAMLVTLVDRWGGDLAVYPAFALGYGARLDEDQVTRRFAELRNVAATLMRVRAGRNDPAAAAEAERRLRFWRGDPDAPQWTAQ